MTTRKSTSGKAKASEPLVIPERIFAVASPRSIGGVSLFEAQGQINSDTVQNFFSEQDLITSATMRLQQAGFEVLQVTATTINIAGTAQTYEQAFNTKLFAEERPVIKEFGEETKATFLDTTDTDLPGFINTANTSFADVLEGVAIEEPRYYMAPSMFAPLKSYWHLRMPGDVSLACNADRAHRGGITGKGVKVAIVDSGWFKHPFFIGRGYRAAPVVLGPGTANPLKDESGHGTGESANIFAVAPDVNLMPVKMSFVNTIGAFNAAVGLKPDIITCSWGSSKKFGPLSAADQALAVAVATAVASGIIVIFAAGNGHWGFPGQHPDVISAGGVFMNPDETLQASNYASGFMSNIYQGRRVPDLSGLVGMKPKAIYIMLPLEPGNSIDSKPWNHPDGNGLQGGTHPNGDETANNDGWGAFSGTSAAAPQLAGAAALIKQVCPKLNPVQVRDILMRSARDVTTGNCNPSTGANAAVVGPDTATGNGLVNAHRAVLLAKIRCLTTPTPPIVPPQPPITITPPIGPIPPIPPIGPIPPIPPIGPIPPIPPIGPQPPVSPASSTAELQSTELPSGQLTSEDVQALEDMIINEEIDGNQLDL
jgi:hypothetical protein